MFIVALNGYFDTNGENNVTFEFESFEKAVGFAKIVILNGYEAILKYEEV